MTSRQRPRRRAISGSSSTAATLEGGGRRITGIQTKGPGDEAGLRDRRHRQVGRGPARQGRDRPRPRPRRRGREGRRRGLREGRRLGRAHGHVEGAGRQTSSAASSTGSGSERCRKTVAEKAKGELAYIHLAGMMPPDLAKFNAALAEVNPEPEVQGTGARRPQQRRRQHPPAGAPGARGEAVHRVPAPRPARRQIQPQLHWGKPIVLLINERSFSDAEVFPYGFKQLGLGKVVGVPTAGGVIGTTDITLSDGSKFRIARVGWYGLERRESRAAGRQARRPRRGDDRGPPRRARSAAREGDRARPRGSIRPRRGEKPAEKPVRDARRPRRPRSRPPRDARSRPPRRPGRCPSSPERRRPAKPEDARWRPKPARRPTSRRPKPDGTKPADAPKAPAVADARQPARRRKARRMGQGADPDAG